MLPDYIHYIENYIFCRENIRPKVVVPNSNCNLEEHQSYYIFQCFRQVSQVGPFHIQIICSFLFINA